MSDKLAPSANAHQNLGAHQHLSAGTKTQSVLWWIMLLFVFLTTCVIGSVGAVAALIPLILALPMLLHSSFRHLISQQWGLMAMLIVFVSLSAVFLLTADEPSDLSYVVNFLVLPLSLPAFLLARNHASGRWPLVIMGLALAGTFVALSQGIFEIAVLEKGRATGLANNANVFGHVACLFGFVSLAGMHMTSSRWRFVFLLGPIVGFAVALLSGSRGSLVAALPLIPLATVYLYYHAAKYRWLLGVGLALVLAVSSMTLSTGQLERQAQRLVSASDVVVEFIKSGQSSDQAMNIRLDLYKGAWEVFLESPVIGRGWSNAVGLSIFGLGTDALPTSTKSADQTQIYPHVHNDFLQFAAGAGLVGILSYFALLAMPFSGIRNAGKYASHRLYISSTLVVFTVVHGLVDAPFGYDITLNTYILLAAIVMGVFHEPAASGRGEA